MRVLLAVASLALLVGCSGAESVTAASLAGTTWSEVCPGSDPERTYLQLNADGTFGYNYDAPEDYVTEGDERWTVEAGTLVVSWSDGYAVTRYDLARIGDGALPGSSTKDCGDRAVLERG